MGLSHSRPRYALYANVNRQAFKIRLLRRGTPDVWWLENKPAIRDWPVWIYLGGGVFLLNILWKLEVRRSRAQPAPRHLWLPTGWPLAVGLALMGVAAPMCLFPIPYGEPHFGYELSPQLGSPYLLERSPILDRSGNPCVAPPWGALTALDLNAGRLLWRTPLGTRVPGQHTGVPSFGGPIGTMGDLLFSAGVDAHLRAFESESGRELWDGTLPADAHATPMTYTLRGRQFVVVAAGGHGGVAGIRGDALVAFALPAPD